MRKLIGVLLLVWGMALAMEAQAVTVYYWPTAYPLKKYDGSTMPQDINIVHLWDGWLPSVFYGQTFQRDNQLQVGGWGDEYRTFIKFDITGLPQNPDLMVMYLKSFPRGDSSTTTPLALCKVGSSWNLSMTWNTQPSFPTCWGWYNAPIPGDWWGISFTSLYNDWKSGVLANNGVMLFPQNTNNNFNMFRSSRYSYGYGPVLRFDFTPTLELKMPLPGNHQWLVTTEVGGYDCLAKDPQLWPDQYHQDVTGNYFAIDFSWRNIPDSGATVYTQTSDIPVLAAAGGIVSSVDYNGTNLDVPNGYYVVVDHDYDNNLATGISTRYLHLKNPPAVVRGQTVSQGDTLGYMGTTGKDANGNPTSTGVHLHFGIRYNNSGHSTIPEIAKVVMDGRLLKGYQTECSVDQYGVPTDQVRYYRSGNRVY